MRKVRQRFIWIKSAGQQSQADEQMKRDFGENSPVQLETLFFVLLDPCNFDVGEKLMLFDGISVERLFFCFSAEEKMSSIKAKRKHTKNTIRRLSSIY